jgi:hypothetical protein
MKTVRRTLLGLAAILSFACAAQAPVAPAAVVPTTTGAVVPTPSATAAAPAVTTLEDALARAGLTRVELGVSNRDASFRPDAEHPFDGKHLVVSETGGWKQSRALFAKRADGSIVRVITDVHVVEGKTVQRGCMTFAGGRGWFEEVTYDLPPGAKYAGSVTVRYDEVHDIEKYSDAEPDGSPCPPPALD